MATVSIFTHRRMVWPLGLLLLISQLVQSAAKTIVCEPVTVPMCKGIGYNLTYMPNQFNHDTQEEVGLEVHQFWPLVRIHCSADLLFFMCSMYTPICLPDYRKPLPPCRSVWERAKGGCSPLMRQYGFEWPEKMNCDRLPELGDAARLCMDRNSGQITTASPGKTSKPTSKPLYLPARRPPPPPKLHNHHEGGRECNCHHPLVPINGDNSLFGPVHTGPVFNCAQPCRNPYFTQEAHSFTTLWLGLWSGLCFLSTVATVATFLIDRERFKYPELPLVYLAACFMCVALGYLLRVVAGHQRVACSDNHRHLLYTSGSALCTIVFLLVYFFSMASSIWWVVLSFTWFLAVALKWGSDAIEGYSLYYHLAAWIIPSVKTMVVLAFSSVDGDSVGGICYVGNQNTERLLGFVVAPLAFYLFVGSLFLLAGFVGLLRIRRDVKQRGTKSAKLERRMIRLGSFTALYAVPASALLACLVYEQHQRPRWEWALACSRAAERQRSGAGPDHAVFLLKYFMSLVVGTTSGLWVWSGKTLESWRRLLERWCACSHHKPSSSFLYGGSSSSTGVVPPQTVLNTVPHPL